MPMKAFAAWAEHSSSFEYIGVHYVDVYYFVTGLKPKRVAAFGQKKWLPTQGKDAYDAVQAVIELDLSRPAGRLPKFDTWVRGIDFRYQVRNPTFFFLAEECVMVFPIHKTRQRNHSSQEKVAG